MLQDIRYALRVMGRSRAFTALVVLSLALGIGANTAIFSLIDTLMLRMLPVDHPEQLVEMLHQFPQPGEPRMNGYSLDETGPGLALMRAQKGLLHGHYSRLIGWARCARNEGTSDAKL